MMMHLLAAKAVTKGALLWKGAAFGALAGTIAAVVDEHTHIPIGAAVSVGLFACTLVLWIGKKLQKLTDAIETVMQRNEVLEGRVAALPCQHPDCPTNRKK